MRNKLRNLLLWLWPRIRKLYARFDIQVDLLDLRKYREEMKRAIFESLGRGTAGHRAPGAHASHSGPSVPGAHVWVLAALALGSLLAPIAARAQQGGQTSSVPPLTGSAAPAGNCGVGSLYVNTTTGDLYDCNGGAWNKVNGGGSGAFNGGLGTSFQDAQEIGAPSNPSSGNDRLYLSSATHLLACLTSSGANCMPSGGAGTVTQVTSGNFSPLFNVSVANQTTTPAFSFAGISQSQNLFFASPNGSSGNPSFRAMVAADVPASANSCAMHQFTISLASGLSVTCAQPLAADIGSIPGSSGQLLFNNAGAIGAEDPVISYSNPSETTAAWTSATANNTHINLNLQTGTGAYSTVIVTLNQGSTITGGAVQFSVSDTTAMTNLYTPNICWQPSTGLLVNAYTLTSSTNQVFICNVSGFQGFQINLSPAISGTATVNVGLQPSAAPANPAVTALQSNGTNLHVNVDSAPTTTITGTVTANQGTANTLANGWPVKVTDGTNTQPTGDAAARKIFVQPSDGTNNVSYADPCLNGSRAPVSINQTAKTKLVSGVSAKKIYVCSFHIVTATAQNVALIEGTGTTCGTGAAGVQGFGGSAAATGWNFAANGGIALAGGGYSLGQEGTAADDLCLDQSGTGQVSGGLVYVQQ